nr:protein FAR1-RELATED SEQUENCE 5-like [Lolium perenne]
MPTSTESPPSERTWKQRFRRGEIPDSRPASSGRKSALETAMRRCRDKHSDVIIEPELGMEFDSLPEAFDFYNIYSWEIGFGIRYGSSRINPAKSKVRQDITCGCEGKPRHLNSRSVCCGCRAMIRLHRTDDYGWYIHEFRRDHNHGLAVNSGQKMQFSSHRFIDPHTKDLVRNLRDNNVGLTKTFSVIGSFFGSMENIPFNKRSLRTLCASISRDHSEDDIRKTYEVLSEMKMKDPNF